MARRITRWSVISAIAFVAAVPVPSTPSVGPTFRLGDVTVQEPDTGSTAAVLTASLLSPAVTHGDIFLTFSTVPGTATEGPACGIGVDFIGANSERLTLSSRQNSARISVQVCGDIRSEPNETFTVKLFSGQSKIAEGHVTIIDNDPAPVPWGGLTAEGTIAKAEEQRWQTPSLLPGQYLFTLTNVSGDADLYVRVGAAPTLTAYSCRPAKASADETCQVNLGVSDLVYVMVRGYAPSSKFKLVGSAK